MLRLMEIRKQRKITQHQLAKAVGVTQAMISHYETGRNIPCIDIAAKIAKALCVTIDDLIEEDDA